MTAPLIVGPAFGFGRGTYGGIVPPNVPQPGDGNGTPVTGRSLEIPLPDVFPIPDAKQFTALGQVASVGVGNNVVIPGAVMDIPALNLAVIRGVSLYIANMLTTSNVTWSLLVNNAPAAGFAGLTMFPRVSPFVGADLDAFIRIQGPATVQVVFSNIDGGSYQLGAAFSGWYWPAASDERWRALGV